MRLQYLKQKTSLNETNFYLDVILLIGFLIIMEPELTGIAIHEWFSLVLGAALVLHIILHWKWIVAVTMKFLKKFFHPLRLKYLFGAALLGLFMYVFLSGLVESQHILRFFGLRASINPAWERHHSLASSWMWYVVGLHLVLDWKWIVNAVKRYLVAPLRQ